MNDIKNDVLDILAELRPDVDFTAETKLVTNGVFDSFDIMSLVGLLSDAFDITISPAELTPANFDSADALAGMVSRLEEE